MKRTVIHNSQLAQFSSKLLLAATLVLTAITTHAAQFISVDDYEVHYIAFNSTFITPEVANRYNLQRGDTIGVINLSVLRNNQPVAAELNGEARNLLGVPQTLKFKEVREGEAVYYLANVRFSHEELWRFDINVATSDKAIPLQFQHKFYRD